MVAQDYENYRREVYTWAARNVSMCSDRLKENRTRIKKCKAMINGIDMICNSRWHQHGKRMHYYHTAGLKSIENQPRLLFLDCQDNYHIAQFFFIYALLSSIVALFVYENTLLERIFYTTILLGISGGISLYIYIYREIIAYFLSIGVLLSILLSDHIIYIIAGAATLGVFFYTLSIYSVHRFIRESKRIRNDIEDEIKIRYEENDWLKNRHIRSKELKEGIEKKIPEIDTRLREQFSRIKKVAMIDRVTS